MTGERFCYVVMCHTDAEIVFRLVRRIHELSPAASVLLRHDQDDFITAEQAREVGADLLRSDITITWGGWSMNAAAFEAFEHARATVDPDFFVLISGQDYPIRDLAEWEQEVQQSGADALVETMLEPLHPAHYDYRWSELRRAPRWLPPVLDRAAAVVTGRLDRFIGPVVHCYRGRRDHSWHVGVRRLSLLFRGGPPLPVVKGAQWMTLSRRALDRILDRHHQDGRVRRFFLHTHHPDEMYPQSLLADDAELRVLDRPTAYARFVYGATSPVWIDLPELEAARQTTAPFVRKVRADADAVRARADALTSAAAA